MCGQANRCSITRLMIKAILILIFMPMTSWATITSETQWSNEDTPWNDDLLSGNVIDETTNWMSDFSMDDKFSRFLTDEPLSSAFLTPHGVFPTSYADDTFAYDACPPRVTVPEPATLLTLSIGLIAISSVNLIKRSAQHDLDRLRRV